MPEYRREGAAELITLETHEVTELREHVLVLIEALAHCSEHFRSDSQTIEALHVRRAKEAFLEASLLLAPGHANFGKRAIRAVRAEAAE